MPPHGEPEEKMSRALQSRSRGLQSSCKKLVVPTHWRGIVRIVALYFVWREPESGGRISIFGASSVVHVYLEANQRFSQRFAQATQSKKMGKCIRVSPGSTQHRTLWFLCCSLEFACMLRSLHVFLLLKKSCSSYTLRVGALGSASLCALGISYSRAQNR